MDLGASVGHSSQPRETVCSIPCALTHVLYPVGSVPSALTSMLCPVYSIPLPQTCALYPACSIQRALTGELYSIKDASNEVATKVQTFLRPVVAPKRSEFCLRNRNRCLEHTALSTGTRCWYAGMVPDSFPPG